jgi:hypothetical protein
MTKLITQILMLATVLIWIGWDIYVASNSTRGDTISEITLRFYHEHPGLTLLLVGALCYLAGHLFWSQRG